MKIVVDGVQYGDFLRASATIRLDALSNTFSFTATSQHGRPLPIRGGEACKVYVDDDLVITGHIELVNVSGDPAEHVIDLQGRDKTGDLLDSSIGALAPMQGDVVTLKALCEHVISHIGANITVVDYLNPAPFNKAEDIEDPEPGVQAFEFIEKYSRKRQALLTSNGYGQVVIASSVGTPVDAYVQNLVGDPNNANNVLKYASSYDSTGRFHLYQAASQLNLTAVAASGETSADSIADQGGDQGTIDNRIREGRQLVLVSEAMSSSGSTLTRAEWEKQIRRARGQAYSATLLGYRNQAGELWDVNTVIGVRDDDAGVHAKMLVNSVTFSLDPDLGRTAALGFVERDAYSLAAREPTEEELGYGLAE